MTNCLFDSPIDIWLESRSTSAELPAEENGFATVPMHAVCPERTRQQAQEEEWYTSFEQAISGRAARVSQQLRRLATMDLEARMPATDPLPSAPPAPLVRVRAPWLPRRRFVILCCLGLGLFLSGFDLLGLLLLLH